MFTRVAGMEETELAFDPSYGYTLEDLLEVGAPAEPDDYEQKWLSWREYALGVKPRPTLHDTGGDHKHWRVFDINFHSTDGVNVGGWLLLPISGTIKRGFVVSHGYSGRIAPDYHLPFRDSALLFYCARGISRSPHLDISNEAHWHVLHDIQCPNRYVLRGCVEDTWLAVSALLRLCPYLKGHIGYLGTSFGGGIGAMALAWESRIQRAHFSIPSFGNQPMRMEFETFGSAKWVQEFDKKHPEVVAGTLKYFDAATAARRIDVPVHCALALEDPVVAPPGQFSIYNALGGAKQLFTMDAGHMEYPSKVRQAAMLNRELKEFFSDL